MAKSQKQVEAMRKLGFTEEEIADVLASDDAIDHGKRMEFDLSPEEEKAAKKYITVDRKKPAEPVKRERKANDAKRELISCIADGLSTAGAQVEVTNVEREIIFHFNGVKYKVVLSAPRS